MPMRDRMPALAKAARFGAMLAVALAGVTLLGVTLPAITAPAQAEDVIPPFRWTDVDFTPDCSPNAGFLRVLRYLDGRHPDPDAAPAPVDGPVRDALTGDTEHRLTLDTPLPWHGLKLTGIGVMSGIERGPVAYSLYFEDSIDKVRTVLNLRGWKIPASATGRDIIENYAAIGLHKDDNGNISVNCSRD